MQARLNKYTRVINIGTALALIGVIFLPLWSIELTAPQYPEGLELKIYSDKLGGDVDVVNGLNHYIGMRTLHEKDFPEFLVLPYIIGTLVFFGLLSFLINKRWFFLAWVIFYMIFSITAMIDFYRWEYNYGHSLDPTAPIQVPGMYYQPPLIGFKQLLNFGVYSMPDTGGMIFIGVALLMLLGVWLEWKSFKAQKGVIPSAKMPALFILFSLFNSCSTAPVPIQFGKDTCAFCKMTISDMHFGGEVLTSKGKRYVFDDLACLRTFLSTGGVDKEQVGKIYLVDYCMNGQLIPIESCLLIEGERVHSPMGGNIAAFSVEDSLRKYRSLFQASDAVWTDPYKASQ